METCALIVDRTRIEFSTDDSVWIRKIEKLIKEHPDECKIVARPEDNDGCLYCHLPAEWLVVRPRLKKRFSDEQIAMYTSIIEKVNAKRAAKKSGAKIT